MVVVKSVLVPVERIEANRDMQARETLSKETVDLYAELLAEGTEMPAVVVFCPDPQDPGARYWLADGFHRLAAHKKIERAHIVADIHVGQRRDAVMYAMGANASHGLPRTNEDKRRAVRLVLEDFEWRGLSDREIAKMTGTTHPFVAKIREVMYPKKAAEVAADAKTIADGLEGHLRDLLLKLYTNQGTWVWMDKDNFKALNKAGLMYKLNDMYPVTDAGRATAEYIIQQDRFLAFADAIKAEKRATGGSRWRDLSISDFEPVLRRHVGWRSPDWGGYPWLEALPDWFEMHVVQGQWREETYARLTPVALEWLGVEAPDEPGFETWWAKVQARQAEDERARQERAAQREAEWLAQRQAREAAQAAEVVQAEADEAEPFDEAAAVSEVLEKLELAADALEIMGDSRGYVLRQTRNYADMLLAHQNLQEVASPSPDAAAEAYAQMAADELMDELAARMHQYRTIFEFQGDEAHTQIVSAALAAIEARRVDEQIPAKMWITDPVTEHTKMIRLDLTVQREEFDRLCDAGLHFGAALKAQIVVPKPVIEASEGA